MSAQDPSRTGHESPDDMPGTPPGQRLAESPAPSFGPVLSGSDEILSQHGRHRARRQKPLVSFSKERRRPKPEFTDVDVAGAW